MPGGTGSEAQETFRAYFSCASLPELRAGCTPTSFFFLFSLTIFFYFARRTSPKSRDYSQSIICVMFGKVNGKSYCKLIVGRASLDVFIRYKNMLLLFLSRYFYARSKTDDFFLYFLLLQAPPQMRKLRPPAPLSTQQEVELSQRPEEVT